VPTSNWQKVRGFPDIADYPDHDACVSCHRPQFFKSARPLICTVCHTKVSPRDDARLKFRKSDSQRQFAIQFPHDKHQDVIARLSPRKEPARPVRFTRASLILSPDDKTKTYNNCSICHLTSGKAPPAPASGWADNFIADAATFKTSPTSHAACFNCHWKSQEPINNNCAGCHKLLEQRFLADHSPKRISMKFRHQREQHIAECTTCHINITKAVTLKGLKPDVPMTSCTECHNKDGLRLDVSKELEALDKNRDFICVYCHTSDKGRLDPPPSHYLIAGREPLKRKDLK
jgi:predicted CXXCH cytochrome family protein